MKHEAGQTIQILLVEDNEPDVRMTLEAMKDVKVRNHVSVVRNGEDAMSYLGRGEGFADAVRPDLVLLDLNLPRLDGREVLAAIKADPGLRQIPVVVLTTSDSEEDVLRAYDLAANGYITKPVSLEQFVRVVGGIEDFWLTVASLPPRGW